MSEHWPLEDFIKYDWFEANDQIVTAKAATETAHAEAHKAFAGMLSEYGADSAVHQGSFVTGLHFVAPQFAPEHWRVTYRHGSKTYHMPPRRKKVDKAVHDHITSFRLVTLSHFANQFGGSQLCIERNSTGGRYLRGCTFTELDGQLIFGIPKGTKREEFTNIPDDLVAVSLSRIAEVIEQ